MSSNNRKVEKIMRDYLERYLEGDKLSDGWTVADSAISGRGLRAGRDFQPGDVIFWDRPVILGPRKCGPPICVGCHLGGDNLESCPKGCKLPVCNSECAQSQRHQYECTLLCSYGNCVPENSWSSDLLRSLTAIRCLQLNNEDRLVVQCLQANVQPDCNWESEKIKRALEEELKSEDEEWMMLCSRIMDTNAFETIKHERLFDTGREGTLRGLYPVAALVNHDCSPNATYFYDDKCNMLVTAARAITSGDELTTSYCSLLWDTASRRMHLAQTKKFACRCNRCTDPTEFGTLLSGLPCPHAPCTGIVLCTNPLTPHRSDWICNECSSNIKLDQVMKLQKVQGTLLMATDSSNPQSVLNFLQLDTVIHNSVVEVQLKVSLCFKLGYTDGFKWKELTDNQLEIKEKISKEILDLLEKLRVGECRLRGLILFELHCTLCEKLIRATQDNNNEVRGQRNNLFAKLGEKKLIIIQ
ncbi:SET domain-containing protein SmydA-8-like isoform X2 [Lycorma delicatula]|uniref:SET domain-containing protein SmydA-8-like isoform X2 n=1 Tax=Lycorma delicatula TaxID=130591 RepID=UPI003F5162F0